MVWWLRTKHVNRILTSFFSYKNVLTVFFLYFWSHPAYNSSIYWCPECNLYNSPFMNLQQIWCLTSDIEMQAIAFENFSKMFLRSILMTPDLLPIATFVKKKKLSIERNWIALRLGNLLLTWRRGSLMENRKIKEEAWLTSWLPRWRSKLWGESTSIQKTKDKKRKKRKRKRKLSFGVWVLSLTICGLKLLCRIPVKNLNK